MLFKYTETGSADIFIIYLFIIDNQISLKMKNIFLQIFSEEYFPWLMNGEEKI